MPNLELLVSAPKSYRYTKSERCRKWLKKTLATPLIRRLSLAGKSELYLAIAFEARMVPSLIVATRITTCPAAGALMRWPCRL